ncbi:hypothetical protein HY570_03245, partial [Candidatus Micrarchaeota archaeon]|nr:hypothetical protein [Candidatus Micrarchaeota archaeon]
MDKICPSCGASDSSVDFTDSFCSNCYGKRVTLNYPEEISLPRCKKCGKIKTRSWNHPNETNIEQVIVHKCKGTFEDIAITPINDTTYKVSFLFKSSNATFTIDKEIRLNFQDTFCTYCLRMVSGYYEAIL